MRMADRYPRMQACWRRIRRNPDAGLFLAGLALLFAPGIPVTCGLFLAAVRGLAPYEVLSPPAANLFAYAVWSSIGTGALLQVVAICRFSTRAKVEQLSPAQ